MAGSDQFNRRIRAGRIYRYDAIFADVVGGVQTYIVFQAAANVNLHIERFRIESDEAGFIMAAFADEPFTSGTTIALDVNADSVSGGQLDGVVLEDPTITGAPLDAVDATSARFATTEAVIDEIIPVTIPAGGHIVLLIDNNNKANNTANIGVTVWCREEGR